MHFVGLDLAWGERKPTGVAVLDDDGRLVTLSSAVTDDEITELLAPFLDAPFLDAPLLAGIDAPLIVPNPTGSRPAEKALNRDFARFDAGAHPANTGKPEFAEEPRGARLCRRLGLDLAPGSTATRRALEVYPHPATVALFRLGRTLKYKNKPGRSTDGMRAELLRLTALLEGLDEAEVPLRVGGNAAWHALVEGVRAATRKSELRYAEDQVDAVVCAYVVLFRERKPAATTTYGDLATGYIVTPTLPPDLTPSPRPTRAGDPATAYRRLHPSLRAAAEEAVALVTRVLDEGGINYLSVTGRAKSVESFTVKAARLAADGTPAFPDPLSDIGDLVGVRVITYVLGDVDAVAGLLAEETEVLDDRDLGQETASEGRFGYASRHLQIRVADADRTAYPQLGERQAQVQIRTVLQHAWAEFEHDIRYKGVVPDAHRSEFDRRFTLAAGLLELADREFTLIRSRLQSEAEVGAPGEGVSPRDLAAYLAAQYPDAGWSRTEHYDWIAGLLGELGVDSLAALGELLGSVDSDEIHRRMGYRHPTGAVRRLDDALLAARGETYVQLPGNAARTDRLTSRLARMRATPESAD